MLVVYVVLALGNMQEWENRDFNKSASHVVRMTKKTYTRETSSSLQQDDRFKYNECPKNRKQTITQDNIEEQKQPHLRSHLQCDN
eukprot:m.77283 g.77283  ORF g.77283 m.77283 type:complete len:85 (+) comp12613_c0_seq5:967-1221(+)